MERFLIIGSLLNASNSTLQVTTMAIAVAVTFKSVVGMLTAIYRYTCQKLFKKTW